MAFPFKKIYFDAWRLTLKNRALWLLAVFVGGFSFAWQFIADNQSDTFPGFDWFRVSAAFSQATLYSKMVVLVFVGVSVVLIITISLFSMLCKIGLLKGTAVARDNGLVLFGENLKFSWSRFWNMLGLEVLFLVPNVIFVLFYFLCFYVWNNFWLKFVFGVLIILYNLVVYFFNHYSYCFVVFENYSPIRALRAGWNLMINHFVITLWTNLLRVVTMGAFVIINVVVAILAAIPFVIIGFVNFLAQGTLSSLIFFCGVLSIVMALLVVKGITSTYLSVVMTKTYWEIK